ncbi:hypothetical protein DFP86_11110 [Paludibacterium purpuratum]|uniref:Uncharacterized protein n=1 Tax=Paludibacterium purpuratum TaxID=1144873 RepID=A0A4V3DUP8_9NEIS|nr:hypothetical protein DFP86_11110 [Paludibacterium purpuratum]
MRLVGQFITVVVQDYLYVPIILVSDVKLFELTLGRVAVVVGGTPQALLLLDGTGTANFA